MNLKENQQNLHRDYLKDKTNRVALDVYMFSYNRENVIAMLFDDPILEKWRLIGLNVNDSWDVDTASFTGLKRIPKGSTLEV